MCVSDLFVKRLVVNALLASGIALSLASCSKPPTKPAGPAPIVFSFKPDVTFTANPNPVKAGPSGLGSTQLVFTTKVNYVEIHVGAPNGTLLCQAHGTGTCDAPGWVADGMAFYLQDSSAPKPQDPSATLGGVVVKVIN